MGSSVKQKPRLFPQIGEMFFDRLNFQFQLFQIFFKVLDLLRLGEELALESFVPFTIAFGMAPARTLALMMTFTHSTS
jgi:hypothetical protein